MRCLLASLVLVASSGCATLRSAPPEEALPDDIVVRRAVQAVESMLGSQEVRVGDSAFPPTAAGLVEAAFSAGGVAFGAPDAPTPPDVETIWTQLTAGERRVPVEGVVPGDLLFFDDTWDRNGNGVRDDRLTHVGVVTAIEGGAIRFVQYGPRGVEAASVAPHEPDLVTAADGTIRNSVLRVRDDGGPRLAAALFAGAARPVGPIGNVLRSDAVAVAR